MKEYVKFTCPLCGKDWVEEQDTTDEWYHLATKQTLCEECGKKAIKKVMSKVTNVGQNVGQKSIEVQRMTAKQISAILIIILAIIAAVVATGLIMGYTMWAVIIIYWLVLTAKNIVDYIGSK